MDANGSSVDDSRRAVSFTVPTTGVVIEVPDTMGGKLRTLPFRGRDSYDISPDGTRVVISDRTLGDLWIRDANTGKVHKLTGDASGEVNKVGLLEVLNHHDKTEGGALVWAGAPRWSPDSKKIAYTSNRFGTPGQSMDFAILVVNADGTDDHLVVPPRALAKSPSIRLLGWIDTNTFLVFAGQDSLYRVRLDGAVDLVASGISPGPLDLAPNGQYLIADSTDGRPLLIHVPSRQVTRLSFM